MDYSHLYLGFIQANINVLQQRNKNRGYLYLKLFISDSKIACKYN